MELTKEGIINTLKTFISDERKIEFLENLLKKPLDKETKKFVCLKIAELNEKKNILNTALQYLIYAETLCDKYAEKLPLLMKITNIYIKLFDFINAEDFFKKALEIAPLADIDKLEQTYYNFYIEEAKLYELKKRYRKAIKFYEFLANKGINKHAMLEKIAELYDKAAMPLEAGKIRRRIQLELEREEEIISKKKEEQMREELRAERLV